MKRPLEAMEEAVVSDDAMDGSSTTTIQSVVDKVVEELTSGDEPTIVHGYKLLHSLSLDRKQWDRLLSKSVMSSVQNHLATGSGSVKRECLEALVSVACSEYACRRLYACQLMPVLVRVCEAGEGDQMVKTGILQLTCAFVECVGEAAAVQIAGLLGQLCREYDQIRDGKLRCAVGELLEIVSEEGQFGGSLPAIPASLDFNFKDNTLAQLSLIMAHLNCQSHNHGQPHNDILAALVSYIDASRKTELSDNVLLCLDKAYRIFANLFHGADSAAAYASRHLESVLAEEVQRVLPTQVCPSAMNAFANYLTLTASCSLSQDIVDCLKHDVIVQFKQEDGTIRQSASNLLRAMSMVCDFTLTPQEEALIYTLDDEPAANCAAIAFFCTPSRDRDAFILRQLQSSESAETVCEFVEAALLYDQGLSRALLRSALLRVSGGCGDGDCGERVKELLSVLK